MNVWQKIAPIRKAVAAALVSAGTSFASVLVAKGGNISALTAGDWVLVAVAFAAGLGIIHQVPNG